MKKTIFSRDEAEQLEQWTNLEIGDVIFDSEKDDWNINTSVFGDKVMNRKSLIFIVEDTSGNKFGCYTTRKISQYNAYQTDSDAFVFSLKSNGRVHGMKKFNISDSSRGFYFVSENRQLVILEWTL